MRDRRDQLAPGGEQAGKGTALARISPVKRLAALCLCLCLTLGLLPAPAQAADGVPTTSWADYANTDWYTGHESDPEYTLTTAAQLAGVAVAVDTMGIDFTGKTIRLGDDIDLSEHLWVPIGINRDFSGEFDGNGKTIKGMVIYNPDSYIGFFASLGRTAVIHDFQLREAYVEKKFSTTSIAKGSILVETGDGSIYNCSVSGEIKVISEYPDAPQKVQVGGIAQNSYGEIKNCSVFISVTTERSGVFSSTIVDVIAGIAGVHRGGSIENCFAVVTNLNDNSDNKYKNKYMIAPQASYCYWDSGTPMSEADNVTPSVYTECYPVTPEQIAGTGGPIGAASDKYANTGSVVAALNAWVDANNSGGQYSQWQVAKGAPTLAAFVPPPPDYIDITTVPDQTKEGTAGQVNADVKLEGQVQESVELISVTLPASIPFIMDVDAAGALQRVLSATATLTNRSDVGVTVTLTDVVDNDPTPLLDKADFVLVPDPDPTGNPVPLTAGTEKNDVLAILAAPADGVPTTSLLKVDGAARADVASVGSDGDSFTIGLTLKVNKTT